MYWKLIIIVLLCLLLLWALSRKGSSRHDRNIRKAGQLLAFFSSGKLAPGQAMAYLRKIDPYVFEEAVLTAFGKKGFDIRRNKRYSGDGGIDGRMSLRGKNYLIQCKRYRNHIDRRHVEDFSRVCLREGKEGYFVHTGKTGKAARAQADIFGNVSIVSGQRLLDLLGYKAPADKR